MPSESTATALGAESADPASVPLAAADWTPAGVTFTMRLFDRNRPCIIPAAELIPQTLGPGVGRGDAAQIRRSTTTLCEKPKILVISDATGYYLYELRRGPPFVGERVVKAVGRVIPINREKLIDGNQATGCGLIRRAASAEALKRRRRWPMAYHLFLNCTGHILGSETPVHLPLEQRATSHCVALRTALRAIAGRQ